MKRSIEYGFRLCALGLLLLVSGCASEVMNVNGSSSGGEEVIFSLSLPGSGVQTRALSTSAESEIKTLDVLVFKEVAPGQELFDYRFQVDPSSISTGSPRQFRAKVKLMDEPQNFVLLANAGDEVNLLSAAGQNKADVLKALDINNAGKWNVGSNYRALPMWGETGPVTVNSSSSTLPATIMLYRMHAKIDLSVSANARPKFELKEVYLYKYNERGRLVPDPGNWSSGTAIAATLPSSPGTVTTPSWRYDASDGVTVTAAQNLIYLFETKAQNSGTPTDEFAVVVGGNYQGNTTLSYYRIDIKNASKTDYADLLRNHRYAIEIADVTGSGAGNPDDAYNGVVKLDATVTAWDLANQSTEIDPVNTLELDSTVALLDWQGSLLKFGVNSTAAGGWTIVNNQLTNGVTASNQTLTSIDFEGNGSIKNLNTVTELSCGYIDIQAGNLKYKLEVRMGRKPATPWAGSNIYWDGSKLTFDDTDDTSHENYQGVFFKWGSLWGIAPLPTNATIVNVYTPTGIEPKAWANIPYMTTGYDTDRDALYLYDNHNPSTGIGDICRYLTEQAGGLLHGKKWRMPSSKELEVVEYYTMNNNFGGQSGSFDGQTNISGGYTDRNSYFPASGYYNNGGATVGHVGEAGYYWSSSPYINNSSYNLFFDINEVSLSAPFDKGYGFSVRCIQE